MTYGWEGAKVRLVPLDKQKHLENVLLWFDDPEITQWTLTGDWPLSRLAEEEFFDRITRSEQTDLVLAIETLDGEHIGVCGIHQIDWRNVATQVGVSCGCQLAVASFQPGEVKGQRLSRLCPELEAGVRWLVRPPVTG